MERNFSGTDTLLALIWLFGWVALVAAGALIAIQIDDAGLLAALATGAPLVLSALILIAAASVGRVIIQMAAAVINPKEEPKIWPADRIAVHQGFEICLADGGVRAAGQVFASEAEARRHIDSRQNNFGAINLFNR